MGLRGYEREERRKRVIWSDDQESDDQEREAEERWGEERRE